MAEAKKYYEEVAEELIGMLERGVAPWQQPWDAGKLFLPHNGVSDHRYRGLNQLRLLMTGRSDPRWMTRKQAESEKLEISAGARPVGIAFWAFQKREKNEDGITRTVSLSRPIFKRYRVFNGADIKGLEPTGSEELTPTFDPIERAESVLKQTGVPIRHHQMDKAFYAPDRDEIVLPGRGAFREAGGYYATALHEAGHATGHVTRLNRHSKKWSRFGTPDYAKEELRAEIASMMLGWELAIGHDPADHAAYVKSWIKVLKDDPWEIERAARDAEHIRAWVLYPEKRKELEQQAQKSEQAQQPPPPKHKRRYLYVPYREKNEAKQLGAQWDREAKSWYVVGEQAEALKRWHAPPANKVVARKTQQKTEKMGMGV